MWLVALTAKEDMVVIIKAEVVIITKTTTKVVELVTIKWLTALTAKEEVVVIIKAEVKRFTKVVQYLDQALKKNLFALGMAPHQVVMEIVPQIIRKNGLTISLKSPIPTAETASIAFQVEKSSVAPHISTITTIVVTGVGLGPCVRIG